MNLKLLKLRMAMLEAGLTQIELAHSMGISESRLSRVICGWALPTADERRELSRLLGKPEQELFDEGLARDGHDDTT